MADQKKTSKNSKGSVRAKAGLTAKAGRRRSPSIKSVRDKNGKRDWITADGAAKWAYPLCG